jgi:hypothetical protein
MTAQPDPDTAAEDADSKSAAAPTSEITEDEEEHITDEEWAQHEPATPAPDE